jgi:hypothetical protein
MIQKTLSEKTVEKRLVDKVQELGGLCIKMGYWGVTGMPDRLIILPKGRIYFREVKTEKGQLSKRQDLVLRKLISLGFNADVLYGPADVDEFIHQLEHTAA